MSENAFERAAAAVAARDLQTLEHELAAADGTTLLSTRDDEGKSLLDLACRAATGDIAIPPVPGTPDEHAAVDAILRAGADPTAREPSGWTPLHTAAMAGHAGLARRLIDAGADVALGAHGKVGGTPLAYALFYAKTHMGAVLVPARPDDLRIAAALGEDLERFFDDGELGAGASDGLDFRGPHFFPSAPPISSRQGVLDEALTWASRNSQIESMEALVGFGADVNANPYRGTALLWATSSDRVDAATWLLDHGADPNLRHDWGGEGHGVAAVALHLAAQYGALGCVRLLLDRGADTTIVDGAHGGTPADWARFGGAEEALALLEAH